MSLLFNLRKPLLFKNGVWTRGFKTSTCLCIFKQSSTFEEQEEKFKKIDKIPQIYRLIYKAPMEAYVKWATNISTVTAAIASSAAIFQFTMTEPIFEPVKLTIEMQPDELYFFSVAFVTINVVIRLFVTKFPLRIYKHDNKYTAVYHPLIPWSVSHHHFMRGQVHAANYLLSPWNNASYKLAGNTSLILEDYFKTPSEFHDMLDVVWKKGLD